MKEPTEGKSVRYAMTVTLSPMAWKYLEHLGKQLGERPDTALEQVVEICASNQKEHTS